MDYSSYFPQNYQSLTAANLQAANTAFSPNGNAQQPQQPRQNGQLSQLPQNMFFLDDPFDVKMETNRPADIDHASFSNESDQLFDDLDNLSRVGNAPQPITQRNPSPHSSSLVAYPQSGNGDLEFVDNAETGSGNSNKRKAQNRAAQRAFRERKDKHLKDLQTKTTELEQVTSKMTEENSRLKAKLQALEMENNALKGQNVTFSFPQIAKQSETYSQPSSDRGSFSDQGGMKPDMQMYDVDSETPVIMKPVSPVSLNSSSTPEQSSNRDITPIRAKAQHLMIQYHDYTHHNPRATVVSPTSPLDGHHYLDCPKVWERIVSHPRFDEVDIEQLCAELNARIKIVTERGGPSVYDVELKSALDEAIDAVAARM